VTPRLSLIVPAFNEAQRIGRTVTVMSAYLDTWGSPWEMLIVLDGGAPGAHEAIAAAAAGRDNVRVLDNGVNRGKGYSVRRGVLAARGSAVTYIDADLALPVSAVPHMIDRIDAGADVVIASRTVPGAVTSGRQPRMRATMGRVFNLVVQVSALPGIGDTQCGLKTFSAEAAQRIFSRTYVDRFGFDVEALYLARKFKYRVEEMPVQVTYDGASSINRGRDAAVMMGDLAAIRWRDITGRYANPRPDVD
jgi:dolichyl-phosphate beta-glucosyltransferase